VQPRIIRESEPLEASPGPRWVPKRVPLCMSTCGRVPIYSVQRIQHITLEENITEPAAVGIRGEPIRRDHAIPLFRVMQPVNSGQIIYSDWLVAPEWAAQLYALGIARHLDPPSADENSQGKRAAPADVDRHCDWLVSDPEPRKFGMFESLKSERSG
jgi:hypothetical protein